MFLEHLGRYHAVPDHSAGSRITGKLDVYRLCRGKPRTAARKLALDYAIGIVFRNVLVYQGQLGVHIAASVPLYLILERLSAYS